jgi:biotin transport system substrate-specific component
MPAIAVQQSLVEGVLPEDKVARAAALTGFAVLGSLLLWASAKTSVPFYPVPMTLQTGVVLMLAAAYGTRLGLATVLLYLAEGAVGLPVFQGSPQLGQGILYMIGPTGGYLLGFVAATAIVGWLAERGWDRNVVRLGGAMLLGDAALFLLGFAWLAWFAMMPNASVGIGAKAAFTAGVLPFLLGDLVKVALAAAVVVAGARLIRR